MLDGVITFGCPVEDGVCVICFIDNYSVDYIRKL